MQTINFRAGRKEEIGRVARKPEENQPVKKIILECLYLKMK